VGMWKQRSGFHISMPTGNLWVVASIVAEI
jgi:hypothetical protein